MFKRAAHFWTDSDEVIVYMHLLAKKAIEKNFSLTKQTLNKYGKDGTIVSPGVAINYTTKTQYLFRINKGMTHLHRNEFTN